MHEYIEMRFRRRSKPFRVRRQVANGIEFDESDPLTRAVNIGFSANDASTEYRMARIRQLKDWPPGQFTIPVSVEDGSLVLRGVDAYSLPEGRYRVTVNVTGAKVVRISGPVTVPHDGHGVVDIELKTDDRTIEVDLDGADSSILRVLENSILDGQAGSAWIVDGDIRPTRRACVLNLLASLRVTPLVSSALINNVTGLFRAGDDRAYANVTTSFFSTVSQLADRDDRPFYREGHPAAKIHEELISAIWDEEPATKPYFTTSSLLSFRAEARPSLQLVISTPQANFDHTFADLDLDLGNPLQDLAGLLVHAGELLDGKPTNHLDLRKRLTKGKAKPYLCYTLAE
jgi:hypothetical protein